ncbi:MAG: hypothetical protein ACTSXL_05355 [Alphaproteobacteria bacterium]
MDDTIKKALELAEQHEEFAFGATGKKLVLLVKKIKDQKILKQIYLQKNMGSGVKFACVDNITSKEFLEKELEKAPRAPEGMEMPLRVAIKKRLDELPNDYKRELDKLKEKKGQEGQDTENGNTGM